MTNHWETTFTWLIAFALLLLLVVQAVGLWRNRAKAGRKWPLRVVLNTLLWLLLLIRVLPIGGFTDRPATHALLVAGNVPTALARRVQDSLHLRHRFSERQLTAPFDSVTVLGQQFSPQTLAKLSASRLAWIPYDAPFSVQHLSWKPLVQVGDEQRISGRIALAKPEWLKVTFGQKTLDSVQVSAKTPTFSLRFPVVGQGRNSVGLVAGNGLPLDTIRFFAQRAAPLSIQVLQTTPDFETKTLAEWLGKQGHHVQVSATLSRHSRSSLTLNPNRTPALPDVIITETAFAQTPTVRQAVAKGKSVLFLHLNQPTADAHTINRALGTRWQLQPKAGNESVPVQNNLTAQPYTFRPSLRQQGVSGLPVAVQPSVLGFAGGRVGISLLNETFPLLLSGDSVAYQTIWTAVLAQLRPSQSPTLETEMPIRSGFTQPIQFNSAHTDTKWLRIGPDTVWLAPSPLNAHTQTGTYRPTVSGWQPMQDTLSLYVSEPLTKTDFREMEQVFRAHQLYDKPATQTQTYRPELLPDWLWWALLLLCLTALWIEPKLN